jgi:hypothetical protein
LTKVCTNSVRMNFKNPLKSKTKDINSQSKAKRYTFCIGK